MNPAVDLSQLNAEQRAAVKYLDGPLLVLAGAGSGKTRVITHKIAWLVAECGIDARHVAAITFTNKAAREMQERVGQLIAVPAARGLTVSTFHSLGLSILRQEAAALGYKPRFSILDAADTQHVVAEQLQTTDRAAIRRLQGRISLWKNSGVDPETAANSAADEGEAQAARLYRNYQETLHAYQAVDFDDLIRLPVELFRRAPEVLEAWRNRLRYLLIDEYQDTNTPQYHLLKLLTGARGAFTAVGDDDQAIYAWRGANAENLALLRADFPALKVIKLEQNYRSSARILRSANSLIANNPKLFDKQLWSELGPGDPLHVLTARDDEHEAESVVTRLTAHKFEHRTRYADYAILYRGNHQARIFEQALRNERIPYVLSGGSSFFERAEIKDLLAYLRLLANADDDPAFIRAVVTPRRGIGAQTLEKLGQYAGSRGVSLFAAVFEAGLAGQIAERQLAELHTFCNFINQYEARARREPAGSVARELLTAIGYENWLYDSEEARAAETKWRNVQEFVGWLEKKGEEDGKSLLDLTQTIALLNILDNREEAGVDAVRLSTLHAAKGLEYPHVFLVGVEEGILPHRESLDGGMVEEERRLMYVGVTRAQRSLTLSHCTRRKRGREWENCEPSRFIAELHQDDLHYSGRADAAPNREQGAARLAQLKALLGS